MFKLRSARFGPSPPVTPSGVLWVFDEAETIPVGQPATLRPQTSGDRSMKRFTLSVAIFTVVALTGGAIAQPGLSPVAPLASDFEGTTSGQAASERAAQVHELATGEMLRAVQDASSRTRLACAA